MEAGIALSPFTGHCDMLDVTLGDGVALDAVADAADSLLRENKRPQIPGFAADVSTSPPRANTGHPDAVAADVAVGACGEASLLLCSLDAMVMVVVCFFV